MRAKGKRRRRLLLPVLATLLVAAVVAVLAYRGLNFVRIVPITDSQIASIVGSDLTLPDPSVRGRVVSRRAVMKLVQDSEFSGAQDFGEGTSLPAMLDHSRMTVTLTDAFEKLTAGARIERKQDGSENEYVTPPLECLTEIYVGQMKTEAIYSPQRCFHAACGAAEFCNLLERSQPVDISGDPAVDLANTESMLLSAIETAIAAGVMSPAQVREIYARIAPAPHADPAVADLIRRRFKEGFLTQSLQIRKESDPDMLLWMVYKDAAPEKGSAAGELDFPTTLAEGAAVARSEIDALSQAWVKRDPAPLAKMEKEIAGLPPVPDLRKVDGWFYKLWERIKFKASMRSIPNGLGRTALRLFQIPKDEIAASFVRRTRIEAHRLSILFRLYRQLHHNSTPYTLDDLASLDSSKSFPTDLYSGTAFRYSPERQVFWSVGANGIDDGGRPGLDAVWGLP